jgi:hypothetical protein
MSYNASAVKNYKAKSNLMHLENQKYIFSTLINALGSMLRSQFSAIFANLRRKNWRFSQKPNVMINFSKFGFVFSQKRQFFR